jgi:hypothetical protein
MSMLDRAELLVSEAIDVAIVNMRLDWYEHTNRHG